MAAPSRKQKNKVGLMLDAVDRVRVLLKDPVQQVEIPTTIVVGDQSSGKSSVLVSMINHKQIKLPRGEGCVTKSPTQIQIRVAEQGQDPRAKICWNAGDSDPREKNFKDLSNVQSVLAKAGNEISNCSRTNVSKDVVTCALHLDAMSHKHNLTLIDLPGIKRNPVSEEEAIKAMYRERMKRTNTVIINAIPANADFQTSATLGMCSEFDPNLERSVLVLTKADCVKASEVVQNVYNIRESYPRLRIFIVRNLTEEEEREKKHQRQVEREYFEANQLAFDDLPKERVWMGTVNLLNEMEAMQFNQLKKNLPGIIDLLERELRKGEAQLQELPEVLALEDRKSKWLEVITDVINKVQDLIAGNFSHDVKKHFDGIVDDDADEASHSGPPVVVGPLEIHPVPNVPNASADSPRAKSKDGVVPAEKIETPIQANPSTKDPLNLPLKKSTLNLSPPQPKSDTASSGGAPEWPADPESRTMSSIAICARVAELSSIYKERMLALHGEKWFEGPEFRKRIETNVSLRRGTCGAFPGEIDPSIPLQLFRELLGDVQENHAKFAELVHRQIWHVCDMLLQKKFAKWTPACIKATSIMKQTLAESLATIKSRLREVQASEEIIQTQNKAYFAKIQEAKPGRGKPNARLDGREQQLAEITDKVNAYWTGFIDRNIDEVIRIVRYQMSVVPWQMGPNDPNQQMPLYKVLERVKDIENLMIPDPEIVDQRRTLERRVKDIGDSMHALEEFRKMNLLTQFATRCA